MSWIVLSELENRQLLWGGQKHERVVSCEDTHTTQTHTCDKSTTLTMFTTLALSVSTIIVMQHCTQHFDIIPHCPNPLKVLRMITMSVVSSTSLNHEEVQEGKSASKWGHIYYTSQKIFMEKLTSADFWIHTVFMFVLSILSPGLRFKTASSLEGPFLIIGIVKYNWCLLQVQRNCSMYWCR